MKVKDLIKQLKQFDGEEVVYICDRNQRLMIADKVIQPNETNCVTIMPE